MRSSFPQPREARDVLPDPLFAVALLRISLLLLDLTWTTCVLTGFRGFTALNPFWSRVVPSTKCDVGDSPRELVPGGEALLLVSGLSTYTFGDRCGSCAGLVASLLTPKIEGFCPNILAAVGDVDAGDFVTRGAKSLPIRGRASISGIRVRLFTRCMASTAEGDIDADMGDKAVGDLGFPPCALAVGNQSISEKFLTKLLDGQIDPSDLLYLSW